MSDTLTGRWTVTDMTGAAVPAGIAVRMEFGEGSVAGTSGCNSFSARLTLNGQTLAIGPARSTRKACNGDAMAVERAFLRALGQIDRYAIASDGTLELSDGSGVLIRARRE